MSVRYYLCRVYGDGNPDAEDTPTTGAYRPALFDLLDPQTGARALEVKHVTGTPPAHPWTLCAARGDRHALTRGNPDIVELPDAALRGVQLAAMHVPTRNAFLAALTGRGVDVSWVDTATSYRDVMDRLVSIQDAAVDSDALDFAA